MSSFGTTCLIILIELLVIVGFEIFSLRRDVKLEEASRECRARFKETYNSVITEQKSEKGETNDKG